MLLNRKMAAAAGGLVVLLGSSAWANPASTGTPDITVKAVPGIARMLPKTYRDRGAIRFGATSTNMPAQFTTESGDLVGVVVEMYKAAAQVLDVEAKFDVVTFDALMPGVSSGRYDVVTMGDSAERQKLV